MGYGVPLSSTPYLRTGHLPIVRLILNILMACRAVGPCAVAPQAPILEGRGPPSPWGGQPIRSRYQTFKRPSRDIGHACVFHASPYECSARVGSEKVGWTARSVMCLLPLIHGKSAPIPRLPRLPEDVVLKTLMGTVLHTISIVSLQFARRIVEPDDSGPTCRRRTRPNGKLKFR